MFRDAIEALADALGDAAGELVFYQAASGGAAFAVVAVPSRSLITVERDHGAALDVWSHEWTVRVDDLAAANGGQALTPAKGDTITRRRGPRVPDEVYRLMTPPWEPADASGVRIKLHSVRVAQ